MFKTFTLGVLLALAFQSTSNAQGTPPSPREEPFSATSADPNYETVGYAWNGAQSVVLGVPLPVARRRTFWVTVAGALNVYDVGATIVFPSQYWRGIARVSVEKRWRETFVGAHVWHESVHSTSGSSDSEAQDVPQLFLNALGIHARHRVRAGSTFMDVSALVRFMAYTCTEVARCVDVSFDPGHGGEAQLSLAVSHAISSFVRPYAGVHVSLMGGSAGVATEVRLNTRIGVRFHTNVGSWSLYLGMQAGNGVGHARERRFGGSLGMRFTPPFAE